MVKLPKKKINNNKAKYHLLNNNKKQFVDKYQRMKEELEEKERILSSLNNEYVIHQNELNMLAQKSQMMMKEAKSETA